MWVRIAQFEGGERDWDELAANVGKSIREGGQGTPMEEVIPLVQRLLILADREHNRGANLILCDSEADLRRVDAAMNAMTPAGGRGDRRSVEMYEVLLDEQPGSS